MSRRKRRRGLAVEGLEPRQMLAGDVVISELMAINNSTLADEDGEFSDWIELHNTTNVAVNLDGYYLTDDEADLTKWRLPAVTLPADDYLVLFASDKNRTDPAGELHTNFQLTGDGEPLALVQPDGTTIEHAYSPFPRQLLGVSYGLAGSVDFEDTLVDEEAAVRFHVPQDDSLGSTWTAAAFDDSSWTEADFGVGYDSSGDGLYASLIATDVTAEMFGQATSMYVRAEFELADADSFRSLTLRTRYDDGFIAYLNGNLLTRRFAPFPGMYDSAATNDRPDEEGLLAEEMDLSGHVDHLVDGTNVLAIHAMNDSADSSRLLVMAELTGLTTATGVPQYLTTPTPGAANQPGALGIVADTEFSVDRGFYDEPFHVEITTNSSAAEIRYTLDGTAPTATSGLIYQAPIEITTTTMLRAAAYRPGYLPSNVDTQTYIFLEDVIRQNGAGLPPAANWGHVGPDYEMDPQVVNDLRYADTIVDDMKAIPSLSLVTDWNNLFGSGGQGIYINGKSSPRAVSAELIDPTGTEEFQIDASVQIQGGSSTNRWKVDKLSMRLKFTEAFGPTKLDYPLFGDDAVDSFDTIILDSVLNYSWLHNFSPEQRQNAKYFQDQVVADLQNAVGGTAPHGRYMHLYLNGLYWGLYYIHERPDHSFAASYLGGDKDDYDVVKHTSGNVVNGSNANYQALLSAANRDLSNPQNYAAVEELLDIDDFVNYMLVNFYTGNTDWAHHNWYASFNRVDPAGRWRFHSWDAEHVFKGLNDNVTGRNDSTGPTRIHQQLRQNAEYRLKFADAVQKHLSGDGVMTAENGAAAYRFRMEQIERAIVGESARWGDNRVPVPFTQADWLATQNGLLQNYFPRRTNIVLSQLRGAGLYPATDAPTFNVHGGQVEPGFELLMTAPAGTIYYTTDGSDPRLPGGAVSPDALQFASESTSTTLIAPGSVWKYLDDGTNQGSAWRQTSFDDASWSSGPAQLGYGDGGEATVVSYGGNASTKHTTTYFRRAFTVSDPTSFDSLTLRLLRDDGAIVYLNGEELVRSNMPSGSVNFGTFASSSVGGADELTFFEFAVDPADLQSGENIIAVEIHQSSSTSSDISFDLELVASEVTSAMPITLDRSQRVRARVHEDGQWSALAEADFIVNPASAENLAITELYYHPTQPTPAELAINPDFNDEDFEFLELMNTTHETIDLSGVRFTDGITFDFTESDVTSLAPGVAVLLVKSREAFEARFGTGLGTEFSIAGEFEGQLSNAGEELVLLDRFGEVIAQFEYTDENPWPEEADGSGDSLTLRNLGNEVGEAASWWAHPPSPGTFAPDDSGLSTGDYNGNGLVEQGDLDLVLSHWGQSATPPPANWIMDLPEGIIDQAELDRVLANWGRNQPLSAQLSPATPARLQAASADIELVESTDDPCEAELLPVVPAVPAGVGPAVPAGSDAGPAGILEPSPRDERVAGSSDSVRTLSTAAMVRRSGDGAGDRADTLLIARDLAFDALAADRHAV